MTNYLKVVIPPSMVDEARKLGINLSEASRAGIAAAIAERNLVSEAVKDEKALEG